MSAGSLDAKSSTALGREDKPMRERFTDLSFVGVVHLLLSASGKFAFHFKSFRNEQSFA